MKRSITIQPETTVGIFVIATILVFVYFSLYIGVARFDASKYVPYTVRVQDATGLAKKTEVRIAGITVGWVDDFKLIPGGQVEVKMRVSKRCELHEDARVMIAQDGLLGARFIDLSLGSPQAPVVKSGDRLRGVSSRALSLDDVAKTAEQLAQTAAQFGKMFAPRGQNVGNQLAQVITQLSAVTSQLSILLETHDERLHRTLVDFSDLTTSLKDDLPSSLQEFRLFLQDLMPTISGFREKLHGLADEIQQEAVPEIREKIEHALSEVETTAGKIAKQVDAVQQFRERVESSESFQAVSTGIINFVNAAHLIGWGADTYTEFLTRRTTDLFEHPNFKTHFNAFLSHPNYFVLGGFTFSRYGFVKRRIIATENLCADFDTCRRIKEIQENKFGLNFQLGVCWRNMTPRFGILESKLGFGLDVDVPHLPELLKWTLTFEIFDFSGANHIIDDNKPHLKFINRLFFLPRWYLAFGVDDFASKPNRSGFLGFGTQF